MSNIETSGASGRFTGTVDMGVPTVETPTHQHTITTEQVAPTAAQLREQAAAPIDYEKRYKDAQAELTKLQQEKASREKPAEAQPEAAAVEASEAGVEGEADKPAEAEVAEDNQEQDLEAEVAAKVDVTKFEAEFTEKGELSAESYAELEGKGFSKDDVDDFIAFRQERNQRFVSAISEEVGGDESWAGVQAWAKESMPEAERDAFNKGMAEAAKTRDIAAAKLLAAGVMQRYQEANGFGSSRSATGGAANEGSVEAGAYATKADWQADMRSDDYRTNPDVRDKVDAKLANSGWYRAQNGL